jgi:hypothetical protein
VPKALLWFIGVVTVIVLLMVLYAGTYPGRVVLINQSGRTLTEIAVSSGGSKVDIESMRSGETRSVSVPSGERIDLDFRGRQSRHWQSPNALRPGQNLVLYVNVNERVDARRRIEPMR